MMEDRQHTPKCSQNPCTCDGYHTFDELYDHRITLWIALCREYSENNEHGFIDENNHYFSGVWRSKLHSDGTEWDGWFILGLFKAEGQQITYHLPINRWEETDFAETLQIAPDFDGHTSDDVLERLKKL